MRKRKSFVQGYRFKTHGVAQCVFQNVGTDLWNAIAVSVGKTIGIDQETVIDSGIMLGKSDNDFQHEASGRNIHIFLLSLAFNYSSIAKFLGVSRERIRQIGNHVAGQLKQRLDTKQKIEAFWNGFFLNPRSIILMPIYSDMAVILAQLSSMSGYQKFEVVGNNFVNSSVISSIRKSCELLLRKISFDNDNTEDKLFVINRHFVPKELKNSSTSDIASYYLLHHHGVNVIPFDDKFIFIHQGLIKAITRRIGKIGWCSVEYIELNTLYQQVVTRWYPKWKSSKREIMTIDVFKRIIKHIGCNLTFVNETGETLVDLRNVEFCSPASAEVMVMDAINNGAVSAGDIIQFVGHIFSPPAVSIILASSPIIVKRGRNFYGAFNEA